MSKLAIPGSSINLSDSETELRDVKPFAPSENPVISSKTRTTKENATSPKPTKFRPVLEKVIKTEEPSLTSDEETNGNFENDGGSNSSGDGSSSEEWSEKPKNKNQIRRSPRQSSRLQRQPKDSKTGNKKSVENPPEKTKRKKLEPGKKYRAPKLFRRCDICGQDVHDLNRHRRAHVDVKSHKCLDCGKQFKRLYDLNTHRRIHTGEKPYKCDLCPKAYQRKAHLEKHILECHVVDKDHPCDICCKAFINQQQLDKHVQLFHKKINYYRHQCPHCTKPYRDIAQLLIHLKHHGMTRYCKLCVNSFATDQDYEDHKKPGDFPCDICDKMCSSPCVLCQHLKIHDEGGGDNCDKSARESKPKKQPYSFIKRSYKKIKERNLLKRLAVHPTVMTTVEPDMQSKIVNPKL